MARFLTAIMWLSVIALGGCNGEKLTIGQPLSPDAISLSVEPASLTLPVLGNGKFTVLPSPAQPSGTTYAWLSANVSVAQVAGNANEGVVTCIAAGSTTITVSLRPGTAEISAPVSCTATATTTPPPSVPPTLTGITLTPPSVLKGVGERQVITIGFVPTTFTGTLKVNAEVINGAVAVISNHNEIARTLEIECVGAGSTTLIVAAENTGVSERATITCTALPTNTTPPSNAPTIQSIIGTYATSGHRISGTCAAPIFNADWDTELAVEASAAGNHGVQFREPHPGRNSAGPYEVTLFYSQFEVVSGPGGDLIFTSGTPIRDVIGRQVITGLELTFTSNNTVSGTERLVGPDGCTEVYFRSGRRK